MTANLNIFGISGGALAFSGAAGGRIFGFNNIDESAAIVVAQANPVRFRIRFHNPGTNDLFIAPVNVQNDLVTAPMQPKDHPLTLDNSHLGGAIRLFANGGTLDISGECQGAWQALAITGAGTTNSLTVIDSNI